jgi:hypothetical protein
MDWKEKYSIMMGVICSHAVLFPGFKHIIRVIRVIRFNSWLKIFGVFEPRIKRRIRLITRILFYSSRLPAFPAYNKKRQQ